MNEKLSQIGLKHFEFASSKIGKGKLGDEL